jgi:hypothetical protein
MWSIKILGFILKLLGRDKPMAEKMGGTVCDQCRVLTQYKEYYRIASHDFCSLMCFYEFDAIDRSIKEKPIIKRKTKKKKGNKK